jgi:Beta protein
MDADFLYCPIIKGKMNDIRAMAYVAPQVAEHIKPLYELPPFIPTDKPEDLLARFAKRLSKLASVRPSYVDFPLLGPGARTSNNEIALQVAYGQLNAVRVPFEPVYGFDRDDVLWPLVIKQANQSGGMLLRLDSDDLEFPTETIERITDLRSRGLDLRMLDIMIDRRYLSSKQNALSAAADAADFIDSLASTITIRKILMAGSCALKTVSEIDKDGFGEVQRHELTLWTSAATKQLPITPIYSDYGVIHPDFSDLVPATHINGKIRYTEGTKFHVHRGHSLRQGNKFGQYRVLSANVVASSHYQGSNYSYGDRYIHDCATGHAGTGNAGTWVLVDQNHHFTYMVNQIQRLRAQLGRGLSADSILESA